LEHPQRHVCPQSSARNAVHQGLIAVAMWSHTPFASQSLRMAVYFSWCPERAGCGLSKKHCIAICICCYVCLWAYEIWILCMAVRILVGVPSVQDVARVKSIALSSAFAVMCACEHMNSVYGCVYFSGCPKCAGCGSSKALHCQLHMFRLGQNRIDTPYRIWPYIWWFFCIECRIYTVYICGYGQPYICCYVYLRAYKRWHHCTLHLFVREGTWTSMFIVHH